MEKLEVNIIIEILGRPPENVKEAMQNIATKIGAEKGIKVKSRQLHDPVPVEDVKNLYTAFMELTLEIDSMRSYLNMIFTYMPSHVELVKPESLIITNSDLNEIANSVTLRLHHYDAIAKQMLAEKDILIKQLYQYAPHLFKKPEQAVKESKKAAKKKISKKSGKKTKKR